jgi:hypothetical protein
LLTAGLARLATGILIGEKRGTQGDSILAIILNASRQLRYGTHGQEAQQLTWVLEKLAQQDEKPTGKLHITDEGARHIAIAFQKADEGFAAKDILALTARNLGLTPLGSKDENVQFNPLQHEDTQGGLLPGDSVVILESGWLCGKTVVMRAKVRRNQS